MGVLPSPWNRSVSCRLVQGVPSVVERGVTERETGRRSHCAATLGVIVSQAAKGSIRGLVFDMATRQEVDSMSPFEAPQGESI